MLFICDGLLFAQAFDDRSLRTSGFFGSTRMGSSNIFQANRGGVDQVKAVTETLFTGMYPTDVSRDGRFLAFHQTASRRATFFG